MSFTNPSDRRFMDYAMSVSPYSRRSRTFPIWLTALARLVGVIFALNMLIAWQLMILAGIVHAHVLPALIPFGFGIGMSLAAVPMFGTFLILFMREIAKEV